MWRRQHQRIQRRAAINGCMLYEPAPGRCWFFCCLQAPLRSRFSRKDILDQASSEREGEWKEVQVSVALLARNLILL